MGRRCTSAAASRKTAGGHGLGRWPQACAYDRSERTANGATSTAAIRPLGSPQLCLSPRSAALSGLRRMEVSRRTLITPITLSPSPRKRCSKSSPLTALATARFLGSLNLRGRKARAEPPRRASLRLSFHPQVFTDSDFHRAEDREAERKRRAVVGDGDAWPRMDRMYGGNFLESIYSYSPVCSSSVGCSPSASVVGAHFMT